MERFGDAYRAYQRRVPCSCLVGVNGGSIADASLDETDHKNSE